MLIVNVDSDEKLSKIIGQDPMFFDSEREIYPLTTRQTHEKQIRELLQPEPRRFLTMGCHGGFSLDEATRRSWYNPEAILQDLHLGMTFADIGCGDGFFSILAAKKVGETGKVYAVDIDPSGIEKLKQQSQTARLKQHSRHSGQSGRYGFLQRMRRHGFLQYGPA